MIGDTRDEVPRAQTPEFLKEAPGFLIRELFQSYTAGWTRYIDGTLTGPQYSVLAVLMDHDGSDQVSVAQAASLDASTMVSVARRLERRGLIIRTRSLRDGRRKVLQITSLGEELFRKARARVLVFDEELFAHDPARKEEIISELSRLVRHLRQLSPVEDLGELE